MKILFLLLLVPSLAFGQAFTFQDIPFLSQQGSDWARRVVLNGGAMPSTNTIQAMETLRLGCIAAGLTNKIYSLCVFVPDSVIAATTPLFLHKGSDPWTNNGPFIIGDLTVNGLKGDGSTKSLDTGCKAKALSAGGVADTSDGSRGLTVIVTEADGNAGNVSIGERNAVSDIYLELEVSVNGTTQWLPTTGGAGLFTTTNDFGRVGYVSGNTWNDANTNASIYVASPLESHKVLATRTLASPSGAAATTLEDTISVFARKQDGTNAFLSSQRMSLAMVHDGFTEAESAAFWALALACRETLGGGTGDPVHDYNRKIVSAGGAAISSTTSNAARTFLSGLDTDGTLYQMVSVNTYVPDNLTAARTPIVWQAGAEIWTNNSFGETNVSVNGLTGDGTTKYLGTAIVPSTAVNRGFSSTSAGLSMIVVSNNATGKYDAGVGSGAANSHFAILNENGLCEFYAWRFDSVNANFVIATGLTNGFLSGSRTAANAIALYRARSDTTFARLTNGTGAQNGSAIAGQALAAFALNGNGTVSGYSPHIVSFLAVHSGLTEVGSSNLYNRASTFRAAVGGGNP